MISPIRKVLQSVVSKQESRPALKCVHYEKGYAVATDSHQLVRFNNINEDVNFKATINLDTLLPYNNSIYPGTEQLINDLWKHRLVFAESGVTDNLISYLKMNKKEVITLTMNKDKVSMESKNGSKLDIDADYRINKDQADQEEFHISFTGLYLYNALSQIPALIKKCGYKGKTIIDFTGQNYPFTVRFDKMTFLVTPMRVF